VVYTKFVSQMFINDTIKHYFIQKFNKHSTIQDNKWPTTLNDVIITLMKVEMINLKNECMWQHEENSILNFIPLYHRFIEYHPKFLIIGLAIQTVLINALGNIVATSAQC